MLVLVLVLVLVLLVTLPEQPLQEALLQAPPLSSQPLRLTAQQGPMERVPLQPLKRKRHETVLPSLPSDQDPDPGPAAAHPPPRMPTRPSQSTRAALAAQGHQASMSPLQRLSTLP